MKVNPNTKTAKRAERKGTRPGASALWTIVRRLEYHDAPDALGLTLELARASAPVRAQIVRECLNAQREYRRVFEQEQKASELLAHQRAEKAARRDEEANTRQ